MILRSLYTLLAIRGRRHLTPAQTARALGLFGESDVMAIVEAGRLRIGPSGISAREVAGLIRLCWPYRAVNVRGGIELLTLLPLLVLELVPGVADRFGGQVHYVAGAYGFALLVMVCLVLSEYFRRTEQVSTGCREGWEPAFARARWKPTTTRRAERSPRRRPIGG